MKASEFAKTNKCDADWVAAMGDNEVVALTVGQRGTYSGYEAVVQKHYHNGMYDIRTRSGSACICGRDFIPN